MVFAVKISGANILFLHLARMKSLLKRGRYNVINIREDDIKEARTCQDEGCWGSDIKEARTCPDDNTKNFLVRCLKFP